MLLTFFALITIICRINCQIISSRSFIVRLEKLNFANANTQCRLDFHGRLATIVTDNDQAELEELLSNSLIGSNNLYIGYKRTAGNTNFVWEDTTPPSTYTNWALTFPSSGTTEKCTQVISNGKWQDVPCSTNLYYVCQRPGLSESTNFIILPQQLLYEDSQRFCEMTIGTELATIESISQHDELIMLLDSIPGTHYAWLGLNDIEVEGEIVWEDGTPYDDSLCTPAIGNRDYYDCAYAIADEDYNDCWDWHYCDETDIAAACNRPETSMSANYIYVDARLPFASANAFCQEKYGTALATIENANDNAEVANLIRRTSRIGYNDREVENTFEWVSGSSVYTNWCSGEPNNYQNREDCSTIFRSTNPTPGCWRDDDCSAKRPFVCNRA